MDKQNKQGESHNDDGKLAKKIKNFIYHPSDQIGSGFSSQVFKGINELETDPSKKNIAIKVIQLSKIQNQVQNYLLNNQVNALKLLKHPNVLQTIDILMTKNNVYIVTQFCQGGDLLKYIKSNGPFNQLRAMQLIKEIVQGYKCIQENNIIHRDLKTSNIFLNRGKAKIADFGFCQFVGQKKPQIAYNVGSPAYMSPQSYKQNHYSHKSDIWAIGIILYELLVGETPDRTLTYTEMANNLMSGRIKNIQNQEIRKILSLCFKKNLKQRIDSISLCQLISIELNKLMSYGNNGSNDQQNIANFDSSGSTFQRVQNMVPPRSQSPTKGSSKDIKFFKTQIVSNQKAQTMGNIPNSTNVNRLSQGNIPENNQNMAKKGTPKQQKTSSIKPHTEYLLFLYRLLKFIVELKSQKIGLALPVLFKHRVMIQSQAEQQYQQLPQQLEQSYKQFQYLKNRFDEVYNQNSKQMNSNSRKNIYKDKMDSFANTLFTQPEALSFYRKIIKETCIQCLAVIDKSSNIPQVGNRNQVGIILDYLMIQFQLIGLHGEGMPTSDIVSIAKLENIVKQQPKKLSSGHVELLKAKYNAFLNNVQFDSNPQILPVNQVMGLKNQMQIISKDSQSRQKNPPIGMVMNSSIQPYQPGQNFIQLGGPPNSVNVAPGPMQFSGIIGQIPINQSVMMLK